jgi:hypothetical protein
MKRLLPLASVTTTSMAFATLCAGAGVANAAGTQKPCFGCARPRNDNRLQPGEPPRMFRSRMGSPIWISNQGANMAPLYPMTGTAGATAAPFTVNIPTTANGPHGPTGQVGRQRIDVANGRNRN